MQVVVGSLMALKTKIIVTYGPSISNERVLARILNYADIVRLNFSHGNPAEKLDAVEKIRRISKNIGREVALLADLPGPKIRVSLLQKPVHVEYGQEVAFCYSKSPRNGCIPVEYDIYKDITVGSSISIGDGSPSLTVIALRSGKVICRAIYDGEIGSRKGISIRGSSIDAHPPTKQDLDYAKFANKHDFDFVALSFVRSASDIEKARKYTSIPIIAKIEREEAVQNLKEIVESADALMIARGDLALNVEMAHVPFIQSKIIETAYRMQKPVIVATQVLTSMINNPIPTRAEVNSIANEVHSGADCLMLSDETSIGKYPVEAVESLANVARDAETMLSEDLHHNSRHNNGNGATAVNIAASIALAAASIADSYRTPYIFAPTQTGRTAKLLSALRPKSEVIALSHSEKVRRNLCIYRGVRSFDINDYSTTDQMISHVRAEAHRMKVKKYIVISGSPNKQGTTDTLKYIEE